MAGLELGPARNKTRAISIFPWNAQIQTIGNSFFVKKKSVDRETGVTVTIVYQICSSKFWNFKRRQFIYDLDIFIAHKFGVSLHSQDRLMFCVSPLGLWHYDYLPYAQANTFSFLFCKPCHLESENMKKKKKVFENLSKSWSWGAVALRTVKVTCGLTLQFFCIKMHLLKLGRNSGFFYLMFAWL